MVRIERRLNNMHECIKPFQFVKEDENDKFFKDKDKYYIKTKYAGVVETTKEYWERCFGEVRG